MINKKEIWKIRFIFFILGLVLIIPTNMYINNSFILNEIYKEDISISIMGCISAFIIISSFIQLITNYISFNLIMIFNYLNNFNLFVIIIFICILDSSKYFIYMVVSITGLLLGFTYSASVKFSLLFSFNVNIYFNVGICLSALFTFVISLSMAYLIVDKSNIKTYYNLLILSFSVVAILVFCLLSLIIYFTYKSKIFMEQKKVIENINEKKKKNINSEETQNNIKYNENTKKETYINFENDSQNNINEIEKTNDLKNDKTNEEILHVKTYQTYFKNKINKLKSIVDFNQIVEGIKLLKYYYLNLIGITWTIFLTFIIYPHLIPNKLEKDLYEKYFLMFVYQISDLIGNICIISFKINEVIKQKYVTLVSISRIVLLIVGYILIHINKNSIWYNTLSIGMFTVLIGLTNGSVINLSYANLTEAFKNSEKMEENISCASSLCALLFLSSFALSPWVCKLIIMI